MSHLNLDLTNRKEIDIDKDYINKKMKEIDDTSISTYSITSTICSIKDDDNMAIEKAILILIFSKVISIVLTMENPHTYNQNTIDTLLKKYKINTKQKYTSSTILSDNGDRIYFTKYIENNKILIDIDYQYSKFYATGTDQDFEHTIKIDYRILELFEIIMSENIDNLKNIINNTIKARIEQRSKEKEEWENDYSDCDLDINDPETHFELFGEYPD